MYTRAYTHKELYILPCHRPYRSPGNTHIIGLNILISCCDDLCPICILTALFYSPRARTRVLDVENNPGASSDSIISCRDLLFLLSNGLRQGISSRAPWFIDDLQLGELSAPTGNISVKCALCSRCAMRIQLEVGWIIMLHSALATVRSEAWRFFASSCHSHCQRTASFFILTPIVIVTSEIKTNWN